MNEPEKKSLAIFDTKGTQYTIECQKSADKRWTIFRSLEDFLQLHTQLKAKFPKVEKLGFILQRVVHHVSDRKMVKSHMENYLQVLLSDEVLVHSEDFQLFMETGDLLSKKQYPSSTAFFSFFFLILTSPLSFLLLSCSSFENNSEELSQKMSRMMKDGPKGLKDLKSRESTRSSAHSFSSGSGKLSLPPPPTSREMDPLLASQNWKSLHQADADQYFADAKGRIKQRFVFLLSSFPVSFFFFFFFFFSG